MKTIDRQTAMDEGIIDTGAWCDNCHQYVGLCDDCDNCAFCGTDGIKDEGFESNPKAR